MTPDSGPAPGRSHRKGSSFCFFVYIVVKFCTVMYKQGSGTWSPESSRCGPGICSSGLPQLPFKVIPSAFLPLGTWRLLWGFGSLPFKGKFHFSHVFPTKDSETSRSRTLNQAALGTWGYLLLLALPVIVPSRAQC